MRSVNLYAPVCLARGEERLAVEEREERKLRKRSIKRERKKGGGRGGERE